MLIYTFRRLGTVRLLLAERDGKEFAFVGGMTRLIIYMIYYVGNTDEKNKRVSQ